MRNICNIEIYSKKNMVMAIYISDNYEFCMQNSYFCIYIIAITIFFLPDSLRITVYIPSKFFIEIFKFDETYRVNVKLKFRLG